MIEKIQRFLKNKHKYDRKLALGEQFDLFTNNLNNLKKATGANDTKMIRQNLGVLLVELIKFANLNNIELTDLFQNDLKMGL